MEKTILILDLDGVLITTPPWKSVEMDFDGYSKFNSTCVENLNKLLSLGNFEIWLSSTRRKVKTLAQFQLIFEKRNNQNTIRGFLPEYNDSQSRKDEILQFVTASKIDNFLIIDDDKSLSGLESKLKERLVLTELQKGFDFEILEKAKGVLKRYF